MIPPICVSIMVTAIADACRRTKKAKRLGASLIELRLDRILKGDIQSLSRCSDLTKIATIRNASDGGYYQGTEIKRREMLLSLASRNFDYIDIELSTPGAPDLVKRIKETGSKVIISHHDFTRTPKPERIEEIKKKQIAYGADVCKIVTKANLWKDNLVIFEFLSRTPRTEKVVSFSMGRLGIPSRVLSPFFGGAFTYASLDTDSKTAPWQLSIRQIREIYKVISP